MAKNRDKLAALLGAKIVGEVPDIGGGAFGMARLAHFLHQRLTPSQGERPGRPTNPNWVIRPKVPMSEATAEKLAQLAATLSTAERKVSPMQVAAQLLEEAVAALEDRCNCMFPPSGSSATVALATARSPSPHPFLPHA